MQVNLCGDDMNNWAIDSFEHGSDWVRADFHLHTKADKEFQFDPNGSDFIEDYIERLKSNKIRIGVITNHNKFDLVEFNALRKRAKKEGIYLLPGIELSVNDGSNGVHTLIIFSEQWIENKQDYINQFLNVAFSGKVPQDYEQKNGRSNDDLLTTLKKLESYNRNFFIVFAHVEAPSGLWKELGGGRMGELAKEPLIQKHCLGFQKVRTYDKPDAVCRAKVKEWWKEQYPVELEGSDPKNIKEIGQGRHVYLRLGACNFDAVKYALTDSHFRVSYEPQFTKHSHIKAVRFEGGLLDGERIAFSAHLNCLIGIRGSGKSCVLESLRYALNIPFGRKSQDLDYKNELVPFLLKSGGKIVVEAQDVHGTDYEIHRILNEQPDVYVEGELRPGVSIIGTIIKKPLYFGQKDLSATGEGFGQDLVEKFVGEHLKPLRQKINDNKETLRDVIGKLQSLTNDSEQKQKEENDLKNIKFQLEQFEKHGVQGKLSKQVSFDNDVAYCTKIDEIIENWHNDLIGAVDAVEEYSEEIKNYSSELNSEFFDKYKKTLGKLSKSIRVTKARSNYVGNLKSELAQLRNELETSKNNLKEEFAAIERGLVKTLEEQKITSIRPGDYLKLTQKKSQLEQSIGELDKKTAKTTSTRENLNKALVSLNSIWHEEFKLISESLNTINSAQKALKVEAQFKGDKKVFFQKMEETFKGHNIRKETYQLLADKYSDFGSIYKDINNAILEAKSKAETFKDLFFDNLNELLSFQVPNSYEVTYHGKPLKSHSLGQRASAMMLFILSQRDNDLLLIDQPEDDLDNQTIYEDVVKLLRDIKSGQQFIFATHNANFPVLGDAEYISACSFHDDSISVHGGSIDCKESQQKVIDIMEGGKEAFDRRKIIYQIWNATE